MAKVSSNLQKLVVELEKVQRQARTAAVMKTKEQYLAYSKAVLKSNVESALSTSKEYNTPEFKAGIMEAINDDRVIIFKYESGRVYTIVQMNLVAGRLSDYAAAVEKARATLERGGAKDMGMASRFWKNIIYRQAREGLKVKQRRTKGQKGRTPSRVKEGKNLYRMTIKERLSNCIGLAPWWELLDKGNTGTDFPDRGGTPYPSSPPTRFVEKTEAKLDRYIQKKYARIYDELLKEISKENYGYENLYNDITSVVRAFNSRGAGNYTPGKIFKYIEMKSREYILYLTETGQLGFRLA